MSHYRIHKLTMTVHYILIVLFLGIFRHSTLMVHIFFRICNLTVVKWILEAWKEITPEIIKKSFKSSSFNVSFKVCALNLATDGSEVMLIHCFIKDHPCKTGKEILENQLSILTEKICKPVWNWWKRYCVSCARVSLGWFGPWWWRTR